MYELRLCNDTYYYLYFDNELIVPYVEFDKFNKECAVKMCDLLNGQQATIEELQQKYDKLCIEMANIYSKYIFMEEFSEDTNPNEAVKYVLRELMQKTKGAR